MGNPSTAAEDPIYWSFHSFIDLQFARWQQAHGADPTCMNCRLRGFPDRDDRLPPLVSSVVSTADLGYEYEYDEPLPSRRALLLAARPNKPRRVPLNPIHSAADRTVALWGGEGPFQFNFTVPPPDFEIAKIKFTQLTIPQTISYQAELFAHPRDRALRASDPDFRQAYRLGSIGLWRGHAEHARRSATASESVTRQLKKIAADHAGEDWVLSVVVRTATPGAREELALKNEVLADEVRFRRVYLLLDGASID